MANKLLRTVRTRKKAKELLSKGNVTVFEKTTYGYRHDKTVSSNLIQDIEFQVFDGIFYNYQLPLRENQKAELMPTT